MKQKTKLIALISSFCLVLALGIIGVLAVTDLTFNMGGSVSFTAEGVNALVHDAVFDGITPSDGAAFKSFEVTTDSAEPTEGFATWGKENITYVLDSDGKGTVSIQIDNTSENNEKIKVETTIVGSIDALKIEATPNTSIDPDDSHTIVITFATDGIEVNAQTSFDVAIKLSLDKAFIYDTTQANPKYLVSKIVDGGAELSCSSQGIVTEAEELLIPNYVITNEGTFPVTGIEDTAFESTDRFVSVVIPEGMITIGNAFAYGERLKEVVLPSTITAVHGAFAWCLSLISVTIYATTPPYIDHGFSGGAYPIYVPAESVDAYKNDTTNGWSAFADRIQPIP